jgi:hypothetical protein
VFLYTHGSNHYGHHVERLHDDAFLFTNGSSHYGHHVERLRDEPLYISKIEMCFRQMGVAIVDIMLRDSMMNSCTSLRLRCGFPHMGVAIVGVMLKVSMTRIVGKYLPS